MFFREVHQLSVTDHCCPVKVLFILEMYFTKLNFFDKKWRGGGRLPPTSFFPCTGPVHVCPGYTASSRTFFLRSIVRIREWNEGIKNARYGTRGTNGLIAVYAPDGLSKSHSVVRFLISKKQLYVVPVVGVRRTIFK